MYYTAGIQSHYVCIDMHINFKKSYAKKSYACVFRNVFVDIWFVMSDEQDIIIYNEIDCCVL